MKVQFVCDCEIEILENEDEEDGKIQLFRKGDIAELTIIDHPSKWNGHGFVEDQELVNVQFDDGSVAFGISTEWYNILEKV